MHSKQSVIEIIIFLRFPAPCLACQKTRWSDVRARCERCEKDSVISRLNCLRI